MPAERASGSAKFHQGWHGNGDQYPDEKTETSSRADDTAKTAGDSSAVHESASLLTSCVLELHRKDPIGISPVLDAALHFQEVSLSSVAAELIFFGSFALTVLASVVLSRRLDQLGAYLRLSASLLGAVAALGADAPEISSAITALRGGHHDLGLGIVLGSNLFNIAVLLGVSALFTGDIHVSRWALLLNGGASLCVLGVVAMQLLGQLKGSVALALLACVLVPYLLVLARWPAMVLRWAAKLGLGAFIHSTESEAGHDNRRAERASQPSRVDLLGIVPVLVTIVVGSIGMVRTATTLANRWHINDALVGAVGLAALTGIPNVVTAVQLARRRRGSAVLSEALNSNTFNLIVGASVPMSLFGAGSVSARAYIALCFLVGATVGVLALAMLRERLDRVGGILVLLVYGAFVTTLLLHR